MIKLATVRDSPVWRLARIVAMVQHLCCDAGFEPAPQLRLVLLVCRQPWLWTA